MRFEPTSEWHDKHSPFVYEWITRQAILYSLGNLLETALKTKILVEVFYENGVETVKITANNISQSVNINLDSNKVILIDVFKQLDIGKFM